MMAKPKKKAKQAPRKRKMLYKCVNKSEAIKNILHQEKNEHGAYNNITKSIPYFHLTFMYFQDHNRVLDVNEPSPVVLSAQFSIETSNKAVADKYIVGQEYKELPISV